MNSNSIVKQFRQEMDKALNFLAKIEATSLTEINIILNLLTPEQVKELTDKSGAIWVEDNSPRGGHAEIDGILSGLMTYILLAKRFSVDPVGLVYQRLTKDATNISQALEIVEEMIAGNHHHDFSDNPAVERLLNQAFEIVSEKMNLSQVIAGVIESELIQ